MPSHIDFLGPAEESQATTSDKEVLSLDDNPFDAGCLRAPGLAADVDDWVLHGVDINLYDILFEGWGT